ncbi:MAG: isocitrate/isopropylmalate family dehydrogenase, partial [Acidobacteriota bacterium]
MSKTITLLPGDGIGPEVTGATVRVVEAVGGDFEWESHVVGAEAVQRGDAPLPQRVIDSIQRNKTCLKGPVTTPVGKGFRSINVQLRQAL